MILVGTSGWSYDDWAGEFYPAGLGKEKWLEFYARHFRTTEINSSYYAFPSRDTVQGWIAKASRLQGFEFSIKMPRSVTHDSLLLDVERALEFEFRVLAPMRDASCLGAVLIQLSPYVTLYNREERTDHLERLEELLSRLDTQSIDYAVEFRNRSWLDGGRLRGEAKAMLKGLGVAACAVDGPSMPPIVEDTARHVYVRFHGRNADIWYRRKEGDARTNRYDYNYTREELQPWKRLLEPHAGGKIRAYFNNHPRANAVRNAVLFESIMGLRPAQRMERQSGLSSFFRDENGAER